MQYRYSYLYCIYCTGTVQYSTVQYSLFVCFIVIILYIYCTGTVQYSTVLFQLQYFRLFE